jgi:chemotaxis protein histidine kinase CheA
VLAVIGVGAFALRGGSDADTGFQMAKPAAQTAKAPAAQQPVSPMPSYSAEDASANAAAAQAPATATPPKEDAAAALRSEKAKAAAAEAQLAALKKAQAKMAQAAPTGPSAATRKAAAAQTASTEAQVGVSAAKLAQFNSAVDDARSMARQAMRSTNGQNAQLAKNYDKYLKTLSASMRGVQSDKEADKLIHQANQTKAYITFLLRQPSGPPSTPRR